MENVIRDTFSLSECEMVSPCCPIHPGTEKVRVGVETRKLISWDYEPSLKIFRLN